MSRATMVNSEKGKELGRRRGGFLKSEEGVLRYPERRLRLPQDGSLQQELWLLLGAKFVGWGDL